MVACTDDIVNQVCTTFKEAAGLSVQCVTLFDPHFGRLNLLRWRASLVNHDEERSTEMNVRTWFQYVLWACFLWGNFGLGARADMFRVYIGTYTGSGSQGIYVAEFDAETGRLSKPRLAAEAVNPSFLAIHPTGKYLYAVNETADFEGKKSGALTAFAIDQESGRLKPLNQVASAGAAPCHLVVDQAGNTLLTANYTGGNVSLRAIESDGRLGKQTDFHQHEGTSDNLSRQEAPHAHSINLDAQNEFAFVADLGTDEVVVYRFDADKQKLSRAGAAAVEPGSGPRHFSFHPSGKTAYVINELKSTVNAFQYDPERGQLKKIQTISTLPSDFDGTSYTAEVVVHPSGKFVYGSNRGHDSVACYTVDADTGLLTLVEVEPTGGKTPRNFAIDPTGKYLFAENQGSDSIVLFEIDLATGKLQPTGQQVAVTTPVCVKFLPLD